MAFVVIAIAAIVCIRPASFSFPTAGLDPSWFAAVTYAVHKGLVFGRDIVFTAGPLSSIYHSTYPHELAPLIIALVVVWTGVFAVQIYKMTSPGLLSKDTRVFTVVFLLSFFLVNGRLGRDGPMLFFVLATAWLYACKRAGTLFMLVSIVIVAAFCMAKFSVFAFALPAMVIVDVLSLARREAPYKSVALLVSMFVLFGIAGQPWTEFPSFLRASFEVSEAYSAAMSVAGPPAELLFWLAMCMVVVGVLLARVWPMLRAGGSDRWISMAQSLLLVGYFGILLKAGFVRHDGHSMLAWAGLFLCVPVIAARPGGARYGYLPLIAPLLVSFLYLYGPGAYHASWSAMNPFGTVARSLTTVQTIAEFVQSPRHWMAQRQLQFKAAEESIRMVGRLPEVNGSVDIIPSEQGEVIASGMDFRPRPTIQEYTTFSPKLVERNRAFFLSDRSPEFIMFAPGSIDGRHPASAEGPLWPLFLERYRPIRRHNDLLVLQKRPKPLDNILGRVVAKNVMLGERIEVPGSTSPMFVKIDVRLNLLGRIAELLFKPPAVMLRVLYEARPPENYRLIPGLAREGSILVPTITASNTFLRLYTGGDGLGSAPRPIAFEVAPQRWARWAYRSELSISFAEIDMMALGKAHADSGQKEFTSNLGVGLDSIIDRGQLAPPMITQTSEGVFAHAPSELFLDAGKAQFIDVGFGIRDGAWQQGTVNGVCFSVESGGDVLFSRCLDPKSVPSDRGPQSARIALSKAVGELKLRTVCVKTCNWAWSYWSKAEPVALR